MILKHSLTGCCLCELCNYTKTDSYCRVMRTRDLLLKHSADEPLWMVVGLTYLNTLAGVPASMLTANDAFLPKEVLHSSQSALVAF